MTKEARSPHGYVNGRDLSGAVRSASGDPASSGRVRLGRTGSDHPAWRGNAVSKEAGRCRAQRKYPEGQPCEICGVHWDGGHSVERHHRDGNTLNNDLENISWLCPIHHGEAHRRMERQNVSTDGTYHGPYVLDNLESTADVAYAASTMAAVCLCGGTIVAANNPGMIQAAVAVHNGTSRHLRYRERAKE